MNSFREYDEFASTVEQVNNSDSLLSPTILFYELVKFKTEIENFIETVNSQYELRNQREIRINESIQLYGNIEFSQIEANPELSPDHIIRCIFVGYERTGKSGILAKYNNAFETDYLCTIGVDFSIKSYIVQNRYVKTQFWDTAGQDRYLEITKSYYRTADCIVFVYDMSNK